MHLSHKWMMGAAIALTSVAALTGCASHSTTPTSAQNAVAAGAANPTNNTVDNTTNNTANAVTATNTTTGNAIGSNSTVTQTSNPAFPTIVNQSMIRFGHDVLDGAEAPTKLPTAATGAGKVFYTTSQSTQPSAGEPAYSSMNAVTLKSSNQTLASWTNRHFTSSSQASQGFKILAGPTMSSSQNTPIVLTGNHAANEGHSGGSTSIQWTEGKWNIQVTNENTLAAATPLADDVAKFLDQNSMPVPHDDATIHVTSSSDGSSVNVDVIWQEDDNLYQLTTTQASANPINTALAMAISMEPYAGN
ncbi:hypothetical protein NZD89_26405 [Alicyclobacillus fastidiosus]|uniref:Lipoprotein n=1 Tax=Alicyclobacillus fastidiosus TaxID=392011 RepID=A0ABY6ZFL3_9BACL|nr:hypothetical protein [Alicyclobacillus fastidiosus]WAH41700.1 hypothetical protein NZD89_26405 [Alicyclobacillus fastidiosus]GMA63379.1 hypothetical protein GCM10025859_38190 [Alicyclobacillus fastidiosus]